MKILPIALLLAFIFFTVFLHQSKVMTHLHHEHKAVLTIDDWNTKSTSDDEDKHLHHLYLIGVLTLISQLVVTIHRISPRIYTKSLIFLLPVFHQSNYVISSPDLIS
ncbi:hypothetical protein MLOOGBEN_16520 [Bacillus sp. EB106-08-02-XG196]|uniref:hypothetical protein n=1 Tax=Bacillus sp. EB106-08-02-XG196 TaxID=2737049 RepID=UPI0018170F9D|nr:hypothetical protein [Bacillus sp. EB106-08-02-XG196]NWQ42306.1 hypothetical protein [Bacillus sp. EB106-08-02-XG196]